MYRFVFTSGDINGIGPEIIVKTLKEALVNSKHKFIIPIAKNVIKVLDEVYELNFKYVILESDREIADSNERVIFLPLNEAEFKPGVPTIYSGASSIESIKRGYSLIENKIADAIVTAPISKEAIINAGFTYPGHTELFQELTGANQSTMMFLSRAMKCGLATIHTPIREVPDKLSQIQLRNTINAVFNSLKDDLGYDNPKIAILGLNPHAGENGKLGKEEDTIIRPVIKAFNKCEIEGPYPADAFFGNKFYRDYDAFIAMYHDQALIPFKMLNFSSGVNFTAGIPIVRTSPDHGTAFDIAWKNLADHLSFLQAFIWAETIITNRKV